MVLVQLEVNMQTDPFLSPCTKLNSKWLKDLHKKQDTLKLIEKTLGKTLEDMDTGEKFLNRSPIAYALSYWCSVQELFPCAHVPKGLPQFLFY